MKYFFYAITFYYILIPSCISENRGLLAENENLKQYKLLNDIFVNEESIIFQLSENYFQFKSNNVQDKDSKIESSKIIKKPQRVKVFGKIITQITLSLLGTFLFIFPSLEVNYHIFKNKSYEPFGFIHQIGDVYIGTIALSIPFGVAIGTWLGSYFWSFEGPVLYSFLSMLALSSACIASLRYNANAQADVTFVLLSISIPSSFIFHNVMGEWKLYR